MSKISCSSCGKIHERNYICEAKRKAIADKRKRDRTREDNKLYNTDKWKKLRDNILEEYNKIDLFSYYVYGKIVKANCVHHIAEIVGDNEGAYDWDNLIPLSIHVHRNIIHMLYKTKCEKHIKDLLREMINDYSNNKKELGSYKDRFNEIAKDYVI